MVEKPELPTTDVLVMRIVPANDTGDHGRAWALVLGTFAFDDWLGGFSRDAGGQPRVHLERQHAQELLQHLEQMQRTDRAICAWNGLSFDLRWIAHAANDVAIVSRTGRRHQRPSSTPGHGGLRSARRSTSVWLGN